MPHNEEKRPSLTGDLQGVHTHVDELLDEMALLLQRVPAESVSLTLEELGDLTLVMDNLKILLKEGLKQINKPSPKMHEHFCHQMADEEEVPYRHPRATFTPDVWSEFDVKDPQALMNYLAAERGGDREAALGEYMEVCRLKSRRKTLCESALSDGQPLPDGMKRFSMAKVTIRRKKKGEGDERRASEDF